MPGPADFAKLVPGFDFLQGLMKTAGGSLPSMGQWIAPTLDPEEIEKRIEQLRTVQFWLEQNARMLAATIQALEVQRMTLATLKGMNLPMDGVREAFKLGTPPAATRDAESAAQRAAQAAQTGAADTAQATGRKRRAGSAKAAPKGGPAPGSAVADPMQWWGALTQQFTELATQALKDSSTEAARHLAGQALKTAVGAAGSIPAKVARKARRKA
jgi:hypothetical protein